MNSSLIEASNTLWGAEGLLLWCTLLITMKVLFQAQAVCVICLCVICLCVPRVQHWVDTQWLNEGTSHVPAQGGGDRQGAHSERDSVAASMVSNKTLLPS